VTPSRSVTTSMPHLILLDRFDMAVAHAPGGASRPVADAPVAYSGFNCDVIVFSEDARDHCILHAMVGHVRGRLLQSSSRSGIPVPGLPQRSENCPPAIRVQRSDGIVRRPGIGNEPRHNKPVIVQNRDVIAKILAGDSDLPSSPRQPQKPEGKRGYRHVVAEGVTCLSGWALRVASVPISVYARPQQGVVS
jgi:hypothetical protein